MMPDKNTQLIRGLPARISTDKDGFKRLCGLLDLRNRQHRQSLINSDRVKQTIRHLKDKVARRSTSERQRVLITAFYEQPGERRGMWEHALQTSPDTINERRWPVPSLEFQALHGYDGEFRDRDVDEARLKDALLDFPDVVGAISETPEWQRPALAIWPDLHRDILQWKTLSDERHGAVVLALFAVATILDDVRFLQWAVDRVGGLAAEYGFVPEIQKPGIPGPPQGTDGDKLILEWKRICGEITEITSKLGGVPPQPSYLQDLLHLTAALEQLREALVHVLERDDRENLLKNVAEKITAIAHEYDKLPIEQCAEQIHAQWRWEYRVDGGRSAKSLREDINRVERTLKDALEDWRRGRDRETKLSKQLEEIKGQNSTAGDLRDYFSAEDRKAELHGEIAAAGREIRDARDRVFVVVAPAETKFDPAVDHKHEGKDVRPTGHPAEGDRGAADPVTEAEVDQSENVKPTSADSPDEENDGSSNGGGAGVVTPGTPTASGEETGTESGGEQADGSESDGGVSTDTEIQEDSDEANKDDERVSPEMSTQRALWRAIGIGRSGIAYHIARLVAEQGVANPFPPAELIAASTLAGHAQSDDSRVVSALRRLFENINPDKLSYSELGDHENDAVNLLLFSATLRPTLFAPSTGAASLLRRVSVSSEGLAPVYQLAKTMAEHADRLQGVRLDSSLFRATGGGYWQEAFDAFAVRVGEWRNRAASKHNLFGRADRVWHDLLSDNGCLAELAALVRRDHGSDRSRVEAICKQIRDRRAFSELVQRTDRKGRGVDPIQGRALKQLWNDVQPALEFGAEWLRMMDLKPNPSGYVSQRIEALRKDLDRYGANAVKAIEVALARETSVALVATLKQAKTAVDELLQVLDSETEGRESDDVPDVIQSRDLLYVTALELDTRFTPASIDDAPSLLTLLLDSEAHADAPRAAFDARLARGDLIGASLACDLMDEEGDPDTDQCRESVIREIEDRRQELRKALAAEERRLEHAFCRGQINADERSDMAAELVAMRGVEQSSLSIPPTLSEVVAVAGAFPRLDQISRKIKASCEERMRKTRVRLVAVPADRVDDDVRLTVDQAIDAGNLLTANEQISRLEEGQSVLPPPVLDDPFRDFVSVVEEIERDREATGMAGLDIVRRAEERESIGGVFFKNLTELEGNQAADLLRAWYGLARTKRVAKNTLQDLLQHLGFKVRSISTVQVGRGWPRADVETEVIDDRALCPSRQFGSEAAGRYRVLLNWERPADESILRSVGDDGLIPTVVLHFGCLGADREKLRAQTGSDSPAVPRRRRGSHPVPGRSSVGALVGAVSLLAAVHLCRPLCDDIRRGAAGACSTAETRSDSWEWTSRLARASFMAAVSSARQHSCGALSAISTGLTRRTSRSGSISRSTRSAMRGGQVTFGRYCSGELGRLGVIEKGRRELDPGDRKQVDAFLNRIRQWLAAQQNRRLLLLLDEADEFLNKDARTDFKESARLKGLMDETERRFKVVFAGLHNVLRTTRQANHPLAHFGDPIRIGAMLSNGEWREAQALVRGPLQAVGCRFERDDLSTRVLAHTNYYPSLIQLYGAELVRRLRDSTKHFPYEIDDDDINDAYASRDLRSAIRERFLLTLQLDQRYEVLAYVLALELHDGDLSHGLDRGCASGMGPGLLAGGL